MSIKERVKAPTPPFYRRLRNIGLIAMGISTSVLAAPIHMPALVTDVAGYLAVAGTVASTICQTVTGKEQQ